MLSGTRDEQAIRQALVRAVAQEQARRSTPVDVVVITGDVFDSSGLRISLAVDTFLDWQEQLFAALKRRVSMVVIPGNHDRRRLGLFGPHQTSLFKELARRSGNETWVHGVRGPFLADVLPTEAHSLPAWVIAYDSTYLPKGWLSAGGVLREEDLLQAAARIGTQQPDWPILFLLHHHLVPTPLTDVGPVEMESAAGLLRWSVNSLLPAIVSNADREELTMTALGAGTALSTLHTLGRAVVVLHGHKHYATARAMSSVTEGNGDVLLISGGSCGMAQSWYPTTRRDAARLWPSFNWIDLEEDRLAAELVSFGYSDDADGDVSLKPLVRATRCGRHWETDPVPPRDQSNEERRLTLNQLVCHLSPSARTNRWDCRFERSYEGETATAPESFSDTIDALEDSELRLEPTANQPQENILLRPPCEVELKRSLPLRYQIFGGLCRNVDEAYRLFGSRWAPFAWIGIMNRYFSDEVVVHVTCDDAEVIGDAFASETDLGSGQVRPLSVLKDGSGRVTVRYPNCPPRTWVRVQWPLAT